MVTRRPAVADTAAVCTRLRSSFDIPVSLLITPTLLGDGDLERFKSAGADKIGVAVDLATPTLFDRYGRRGEAPHWAYTGSVSARRRRLREAMPDPPWWDGLSEDVRGLRSRISGRTHLSLFPGGSP
jgi:hypothetical protein